MDARKQRRLLRRVKLAAIAAATVYTSIGIRMIVTDAGKGQARLKERRAPVFMTLVSDCNGCRRRDKTGSGHKYSSSHRSRHPGIFRERSKPGSKSPGTGTGNRTIL